MTEVSEGDIVLFKQTGRSLGSAIVPFKEGFPIVIEDVKMSDGKPFWLMARNAFHQTRARILPDQVQPFPSDLSPERAFRDCIQKQYGERKGPAAAERAVQIYRELVAQGEIPEVDENRVIRESDHAPKP